MAENTDFKPIETQEDFDTAIKSRIERAQNSVREEYKDYDDFKAKAEKYDSLQAEYDQKIKDLQTTISTRDATIQELNGKVAGYETDSVKTALANEYHLDPSLKDFLIGENEQEWRAAAERLAKFSQPQYPDKKYPQYGEPDSLAKQLQRQLKGE